MILEYKAHYYNKKTKGVFQLIKVPDNKKNKLVVLRNKFREMESMSIDRFRSNFVKVSKD